jgi:hypothetical protein
VDADLLKGRAAVAVLEVVVVGLLVLAVAGALARLALDLSASFAWRRLLARRVVVNLKSGRGVDGLLVKRAGDLLFLRNAQALEPGAEPVRIDGETVVARADIDFIQALSDRGGV